MRDRIRQPDLQGVDRDGGMTLTGCHFVGLGLPAGVGSEEQRLVHPAPRGLKY